MAQDPDWALIERFHGGDTVAFHEIFLKHRVRVINLAFRVVRQKEIAEDIAQDVFVKVFQKKARPSEAAKFSTWLYRVTMNASLDVVRRVKKARWKSLDEEIWTPSGLRSTTLGESTADPQGVSAAEQVTRDEIRETLDREIRQLPEELRIPILLYQFENLTYKEIASILGISEKAVERRLYHAREKLKEKLIRSGLTKENDQKSSK